MPKSDSSVRTRNVTDADSVAAAAAAVAESTGAHTSPYLPTTPVAMLLLSVFRLYGAAVCMCVYVCVFVCVCVCVYHLSTVSCFAASVCLLLAFHSCLLLLYFFFVPCLLSLCLFRLWSD